MKVLVLGSGAREHALAWKIAQSPKLTRLFCAPGNPGIAGGVCECRPVQINSPAAVVALAKETKADLVVVGPEAPLVAGVADALRAEGFKVFGPDRAAAQIEGSKAFAKEVMQAANIPTAKAQVFSTVEEAVKAALAGGPVVVKADGLAAGKGVVVAATGAEAADAVKALGRMPAGAKLLLEEKLEGPEVSVIALCDGERYVLLPPAQDFKRKNDGDLGPNTGGMGAWAPATPLLPMAEHVKLGEQVIAPALRELSKRGAAFKGALFAGVMLTPDGPRVLEFNGRMGDPETQPLMMVLGEDLLPILLACAEGRLEPHTLKLKPGVAVGVVAASRGYPEAPGLGDPITGLEARNPGVEVFHAGTSFKNGKIVTGGGRVLTVCALGQDVTEARAKAYAGVDAISFEGKHVRRDIAAPK